MKFFVFVLISCLLVACYKAPERNSNRIEINPVYFSKLIGTHNGFEVKTKQVSFVDPQIDTIIGQSIEIQRYDPEAIYLIAFDRQEMLDCVEDSDSQVVFKYYLSNYYNSFMSLEVKLLKPSNKIVGFYQYANTQLGGGNYSTIRKFYKE